ncbi:guanylin-like isoform X2 [Pseudophryne corroboree]|uniref:guanylin-like isoform X2 n=1 Tax=Pseudophryne corroboree TaxID=495146 RepID=UPI0030812B25
MCGAYRQKQPLTEHLVGDSSYSLESVKKFIEIQKGGSTEVLKEQSDDMKPYTEICSNEGLPDEIKTVCDKDSKVIHETFHGFEQVSDKMDVCEICAFAACSGC